MQMERSRERKEFGRGPMNKREEIIQPNPKE